MRLHRRIAQAQLRPHGRLTCGQPDAELVTASIGPGGQAIALWASRLGAEALTGRAVNDAGASFPNSFVINPTQAHITVHSPSAPVRHTPIADLHVAHPKVQALPNGEVLVVGSRCAWTPTGVQPNAAIYSSDGTLANVGVVGDGVEHVRTTANGSVWIGYFDEGIFGNYGWGSPGPEPIGSSGLVRFDHDFEITWTFPFDTIESPIDDCYALNVNNDDLWTCYYSDFPVVQIANDSTQLWRTKDAGPVSALLVERNRVALIGQEAVLGRIEDGEFHRTSAVTLDLPPQARIPGTQFIGQGPVLHVVTPDGHWFVTDLDTLEATAN